MKKIKEYSKSELNKIIKFLEKNNFSVENNISYISFSNQFRYFNMYSNNINDLENGLTMSFDLDLFLKKYYKEKTKHTTSLNELLYNQEYYFDDACKKLGWKITEHYNFQEIDMMYFSDDIGFEHIYQVIIKDSPHIIIDDQVFEGELNSIKEIMSKDIKEVLIAITNNKNFLDELKEIM